MYRKIMIGLILLLVMAVSADAGMRFGPKVGIDFAKNSTTVLEGLETKRVTGFLIGEFAQFQLGGSSNFTLQPEIYFVRKGMGTSEDISFRFEYFEMPILVKYTFPMRGKVQPSVMAGPAISILVSSKYVYSSGGDDVVQDLSIYTEDLDVSVILGAGVEIAMSNNGVLMFDVRLALSPMTSFSIPDNEEHDGKNSAIMISGGWGFNL